MAPPPVVGTKTCAVLLCLAPAMGTSAELLLGRALWFAWRGKE